MSYRNFIFTEKTQVSEHIAYTPDCEHCVFRYDDYLNTTTFTGKRIDVIIQENSGIPMGDIWVVEIKDFRIMKKPPLKENSVLLDKTLEEKIWDSHSYLSSSSCPLDIKKAYNNANKVHYCLHIELPERAKIPAYSSVFMGIYSALVSVTAAIANGRCRVNTPNHSRVEVLNSEIINSRDSYPWAVVSI